MSHTPPSILKYVPQSWLDVILNEEISAVLSELLPRIDNEYKTEKVYPPKEQIFRALEFTSPDKVAVVIVGQDPYHGRGQAQGLSFSVPSGIKTPPSLLNIYKEIDAEYQCGIATSGDLTPWAKEGVLLLNTSLTVREGKPGSHAKWGWEKVTDSILSYLSAHYSHIVFMLWGSHAEAKRPLLDESKHLILSAPHPSPLSAYRGFFGCDHFRTANTYLVDSKKAPINWCLAEPNLFSNIL